MPQKASNNCLKLIEKHEGCILISYICPAGKWSVGFGHTRTAKQGLVITKQQAFDLLSSDLEVVNAVINRHHLDLNQNQFDALCSLIFNIGGGNFGTSTLLKKLQGHSPRPEIEAAWRMWRFGGSGENNGRDDDGDGLIDEPGEKQLLNGLVKRREDEIKLFFS
ncbi:MAG: lysozyme [Bacteroidales bacterium]